MRILMWFTVGFAVACALGIYLGIGLWLCLLTAAAAVIFLFIKRPVMKILATILIGVTVGMLWQGAFDYVYLSAVRGYDGKTVKAVVEVSDYSFETDFGVAADGKIEISGKRYNLRLYFPADKNLLPGDKIEGNFRFRLTTDDALQGGTYHQGDGIFLLAYVSEDSVVTRGDPGALRYLSVRLRSSICQIIQKIFPEKAYPFATALILGDSSALDYETDTDFKVSGIRHVIAVSGLHVSILMSVVYIFTGRRRYLSALIGLPLLFLFAAIVGFTPSVVRACVMQALILGAMALNREYDPPTALSFAVLSMLCVNPMTITSVSFQLSCGCVVGILLLYEPVNGYLTRLFRVEKGKSRKARFLRGLCSGITISLCTTVTTTPLSAFYFGAVSIVGVLTNVLTMWVISFVFWGISLCCLLALVYLPGAKLAAKIISVPIYYVTGIAKLLASLPFSAVYTCSAYIVVWLVMCYALLTVFLLSKRKRPLLLAGSVWAGLVLAIVLSWVQPGNTDYQITVFDVGQGQSVLMESDGRRYLVDCGGDSPEIAADRVMHHLLSRGITHLDGIILTHYDKDHAGAIPLLLTGISVDTLYLPDLEDDGNLRKQLANGKETIHWINQLSVIAFENSKITMVPGEETAANDNERSLCILFQREKCDILITGDRTTSGELALMRDVALPELDLLIVGHHGSKTSTSFELLNTTRPKAAVISVGIENFHGHPSSEVLSKLKLFGAKVWRTDLNGTVVFRG